jgi:hypothetical protein
MMKNPLKGAVILVLILATSAVSKEIVKFTISSYILPNKELEMELDVVIPRTPSSYPVILYLTGMAGVLPSYFQSNLIDSVAEEGYAWLTVPLFSARSLVFTLQTPKKSHNIWARWSIGSIKTSSKS